MIQIVYILQKIQTNGRGIGKKGTNYITINSPKQEVTITTTITTFIES